MNMVWIASNLIYYSDIILNMYYKSWAWMFLLMRFLSCVQHDGATLVFIKGNISVGRGVNICNRLIDTWSSTSCINPFCSNDASNFNAYWRLLAGKCLAGSRLNANGAGNYTTRNLLPQAARKALWWEWIFQGCQAFPQNEKQNSNHKNI